MIRTLTHEAVRTVAGLTRRADAALVRGAARNAAASLTTLAQHRSEGELVLRHLDHLDRTGRHDRAGQVGQVGRSSRRMSGRVA